MTGGAPFEELVAEAAAVPAGADGLLLLPYFAGERTPVFDEAARGAIVGLTLRHERGHLLRAAYEGVAYGIRQVLAYLDVAVLGQPEMFIKHEADRIDEKGEIVNDDTRKFLQAFVDRYVAWVHRQLGR